MKTPDTTNTPNPSSPPPLPDLSPDAAFGSILEALLKRPVQLIDAIHRGTNHRLAFILTSTALILLLAYGLVIGTFSGGSQLLAAPLKVSLGSLAAVLICLPSLFIFTCLTGANVSLRSLAGVLSAVLALTAMLLIGFAPVAWVFSQSTASVAFMGALHLAFWFIALGFGLRLLRVLLDLLGIKSHFHLRVWTIIFILVNLQMTTALRPIIGNSTNNLPREKKFFLAHWWDNLAGNEEAAR